MKPLQRIIHNFVADPNVATGIHSDRIGSNPAFVANHPIPLLKWGGAKITICIKGAKRASMIFILLGLAVAVGAQERGKYLGGVVEGGRRLRVTVRDVIRLRLGYDLVELVRYVDGAVQVDKQLRREMRRELVRAYLALEDGQEEVQLLRDEMDSLTAILGFLERRAEAARVSDIKVLQARSGLVAKKIKILRAVGRCRGHLWQIVEICNFTILVEDEDKDDESAIAQDID